MKKATVYTRKGDNGTTTIIGGKQLDKDHARIEAYGTIDELNANLGLLIAAMGENTHTGQVENITNNLFSIGSYLASENAVCPVTGQALRELEESIDVMEAELPQLHSFVLPATTEAAARANVCRTICRRAERRITTLSKEAVISTNTTAYINRLSDYLFTLSRLLGHTTEKYWEKHWK